MSSSTYVPPLLRPLNALKGVGKAPGNALARAGHQVSFFIRSIVSIPLALKHYRKEVLRLISDVTWGNGSLVVGGGTIGVILLLMTFVGVTIGLEQSLDNFSTALQGINESAPELITVLGKSIEPATTIANKRAELAALLVGAGDTVGTVNTLFARQPPGAGIELVGGLNQVFGGLAADPPAISASVAGFEGALRALMPSFDFNGQIHLYMDVSFTPFKTYGPADCPHYGDMYGPRCGGPIVSSPGFLPPGLIPSRLSSAGPAPALPTPAAAPAPVLPPPPLAGLLPEIPGIQLPGLPQIPGIIPPAPATKPAALGTVLGKEPNGSQALLLGSALTGLDVTVTPRQEAEEGER